MSAFLDIVTDFVWHTSQLRLTPTALTNITTQFPYFQNQVPTVLKIIGSTNFHPISSTGFELSGVMPIVNAPVRVYYGYNWLRVDQIITPPGGSFPPATLFPNQATYDSVLPFFGPLRLRDRKGKVGFTVARQF
jgi:hypothetical protein